MRAAAVEDAAEVVDAGGAIHGETELRELERNVPADPGRDDSVNHGEAGPRRGIGLRHRADAFPEQIECLGQPRRLDRVRRRNRVVDGFSAMNRRAKLVGLRIHTVTRGV